MRLATEQYPNTPEAELPIAIQQEITRDLLSMQMQPAIMDKYRRFVVVKTSNDHCFEDDKDGVCLFVFPYRLTKIQLLSSWSVRHFRDLISEMTSFLSRNLGL